VNFPTRKLFLASSFFLLGGLSVLNGCDDGSDANTGGNADGAIDGSAALALDGAAGTTADSSTATASDGGMNSASDSGVKGDGGPGAATGCGDTSSVDAFFKSNADRDIPIVYEAGDKGPMDTYVKDPYRLDLLPGKQVILDRVEPRSTMPLLGFVPATDKFEDLPEEVNVLFQMRTVGYNGVVQCTKKTGEWTLVFSNPRNPLEFTRFVSKKTAQ
jgi:hypothetical protein